MATEIHAEPAAKRPGEAPGKMTYEEFLHWEGDNQHVEWVDGQMIFVSSVSKAHQDLRLFLLTALKAFVDTGQIGVVLFEPFQMKTGPDLPGRAPDIMFVAQQNLGRLKRNHLEGPADLAVEIISPGTRATDRGEKFYEYEQGGVREYWLLDPERKQAEFYQCGEDGIYRLAAVGADGVYRCKVLEGFWLKVEWLWQQPSPPLLSVLKEWNLI